MARNFQLRTATEKVSEFLQHHLQSVMKGGISQVKYKQDFLEKLKPLGKVPSNAIYTPPVYMQPVYAQASHKRKA